MRYFLCSRVVCAALFLPLTTLWGDTLTLRSGQAVSGTYLGGSAREIRMDLGDHVQTYPIDQISALQFDSGPTPSASQSGGFSNNPNPNEALPPSNNVPPPSTATSNVPPPTNAPNPSGNDGNGPQGIVIPAGTLVTVRMTDGVDSDSSRLGRTYRATVDEPVIVNGQTLIPRGADVMTKIVEDTQSGKITGQAAISLVLQTITINGTPVDVSSQDVREASGSRAARSAGVIGGTTALGAIIGAVAGGGKGAAIGAASGAAVGTGAQVVTHGQRVRIPSESRLTFTLTNPVNL